MKTKSIIRKPITVQLMKQNLKTIVFAMAIIVFASGIVHAQHPFIPNNTNGKPAWDAAGTDAAYVFVANSDASNHANEFMYFKVYVPGGGANGDWDWYTNPTAYLDPYNFHFTNANLKLYNNNEIELGKGKIKEENAGKIAYQKWSDGLDIVGAGATGSERKIKLWAEKGTIMNGPLEVADGKIKMGTGPLVNPISGEITFVLNSGNPQWKRITADGPLVFWANGGGTTDHNPQLILASNGNLGVGKVPNDNFKLDVKGNANIDGSVIIKEAESTILPSTDLQLYFKLFVEKGVLSEDFLMYPKSEWADYVFYSEYKLMPLKELAAYINSHKRLPDMPSAEEVSKKGYSIHNVNTKLLVKIEELTLYAIDQQKEIDELKKQLAGYEELNEKVANLEKLFDNTINP